MYLFYVRYPYDNDPKYSKLDEAWRGYSDKMTVRKG